MGKDLGQIILVVAGVFVVLVGVGMYVHLRSASPLEESGRFVAIFFRTAGQGLSENAWMGLHAETRDRLPLERFEALAAEHPLFETFESFTPAEGDERRVGGDLVAGGAAHRIDVTFADEDGHPKIRDIRMDGRSIFDAPDGE